MLVQVLPGHRDSSRLVREVVASYFGCWSRGVLNRLLASACHWYLARWSSALMRVWVFRVQGAQEPAYAASTVKAASPSSPSALEAVDDSKAIFYSQLHMSNIDQTIAVAAGEVAGGVSAGALLERCLRWSLVDLGLVDHLLPASRHLGC